MRPVRTIIVATLAASIVASCWQPAFDPELSASSLTTSRMELVSTITVTGMKEYWATHGVFLPRRVAVPTDGIWLQGDAPAPYEFESTRPWYMKSASSFELFNNYYAQNFSAAPQGWPIARMSPAFDATTPLEALAVATKSPSWGAAWLSGPDPMTRSISLSPDSPILTGSTTLLGAGFSSDTETSDLVLMVYYDETAGLWKAGELSIPLPLPPPVLYMTQPITMPVGFPVPKGLIIGFAARKGTDYYLSVNDDDGVTTVYRWASGLTTTPVILEKVLDPLVAVLSAVPGSEPILLSSDGMTMTAHDAAGEPQFSFPVGSLRFVHERYDATATPPRWMAVFCRTIFIRDQKDDNGTLRTEVFEIPVSGLSSLEP